jgi:hypothetical protein
MTHQVFISYSSKDKHVGDAACALLEQRGYRCWIAPRDILPGQEWGGAIIDGITGGRVFVLIFSANANESPQVRREVERAVHHGLPIIPFRIEDVPPSRSLEYFMSAPHWLDALTPPLEAHLDYLADSVGRLLDDATPAERSRRHTSDLDIPPRRPASVGIERAFAIGAAFAAMPLLLILAGLSPPWPPGMGYISAALLLGAPVAAAQLAPAPRPGRARLLAGSALALAAIGLLVYLLLYSFFVETVPGTGVRVVRGYVCTPDALLVYKESCPDLPRDALRDAEWESATLWTRSSVTAVRMAMMASWLAFAGGLAALGWSLGRARRAG